MPKFDIPDDNEVRQAILVAESTEGVDLEVRETLEHILKHEDFEVQGALNTAIFLRNLPQYELLNKYIQATLLGQTNESKKQPALAA